MVKVKKCCCCVPVKTGVLIFGALDFLMLLASMFKVDMISFAIQLYPSISFIAMLIKDNRQNRKFYFVSFLLYRIIIIVLYAFKVWKDIFEEPTLDEQNAIDIVCK